MPASFSKANSKKQESDMVILKSPTELKDLSRHKISRSNASLNGSFEIQGMP
ncbi:unnamed protein product [Ceratitis capitata]|uniref:(Mediterranean fruit fly) hypothetical protein n=1 Tax=Ceratitis capitata TaxID=7213 RepID=A0A811V3E4_CERCA|nr:unnamed protein product [Ceratitis capitata]